MLLLLLLLPPMASLNFNTYTRYLLFESKKKKSKSEINFKVQFCSNKERRIRR